MPTWLATTLSVIAAWLGDRRITERDRERRREERHERLVTRRNDFQRETLLALQEASQKLVRNTGASLHQDIVAHRTTGRWQRQQLPDDLSDDGLRLITETMLLASRVIDDETRTLADRLRDQASSVSQSPNEDEAERRMMIAATTQGALIERIGAIVRGLDEAD